MKKEYKIALLIVTTLTLFCCSNQTEENDLTKDNLKGEIKSFTVFSYKAENRFGKVEKGIREKDFDLDNDLQKKYDENKNIIEKNHYNLDGSLSFKVTYKYDENGTQIEEIR